MLFLKPLLLKKNDERRKGEKEKGKVGDRKKKPLKRACSEISASVVSL